MASLTPEQRRVLRAYKRAIRDTGATKKPAKALVEGGLVESNLRNLPYGDRDSTGSLQQRASSGYKHAQNPYLAAVDFLKQAIPLKSKYGTAGQLAQAVQRSAYPGRYDQRSGQANALLQGRYASSAPAKALPQLSNATGDAKTQIALSLLGMGNLTGGYSGADPLTTALLSAAQAQNGAKRSQVTTSPAKGGQQTQGVTHFDGKPVASWIAPILQQARATGLWKGSVTSGERTKAEQLAAAKRFGLQHYPNGPLASNHVYGHGGAVDVSDPQGLKRALKALHSNRLKSAMANDPVHFSRSGY